MCIRDRGNIKSVTFNLSKDKAIADPEKTVAEGYLLNAGAAINARGIPYYMTPVSYTHLDVYKRQLYTVAGFDIYASWLIVAIVVAFLIITPFDIFENPQHPYTIGLVRAVPRLDLPRRDLFTWDARR